MVMLFRMKNSSGTPGFLSTSYAGELVKRKGDRIELKSVVQVTEMMVQDRQGNNDIRQNFIANSMISNGTLIFKEEEISFERQVDPSDEFLKGYFGALEALRLSKINIQKASAIPQAPEMVRN